MEKKTGKEISSPKGRNERVLGDAGTSDSYTASEHLRDYQEKNWNSPKRADRTGMRITMRRKFGFASPTSLL